MRNLTIWQSVSAEKDKRRFMKYVISIGTNMGDKLQNMERAIEAINSIMYTDVMDASAVYQTEPVGYAEQDSFYNAVLLVDSVLKPHEMLCICLGIEAGFGRVRTIKNGPRILDLDIIFAEGEEINTSKLIVPHPRYNERRFVLKPMLDIFPNGEAFGIKFKHFIDNIKGQDVEKIAAISEALIVGK